MSSTNIIELLRYLDQHGGFELEFLRHNVTGEVHVIVPDDPRRPFDERDRPWAEVGLEALQTPIPIVCGHRPSWDGSIGEPDPMDEPIGSFPDEALCPRCHKRLGPWQSRAFEHDTRDVTGFQVRRSFARELPPQACNLTPTALEGLRHSTPILRSGRLQAGMHGDAVPDRPAHIAVVSHRIADGNHRAGLAAACDPRRIRLADDTLGPAAALPRTARCRRPVCADLFAPAAVAA